MDIGPIVKPLRVITPLQEPVPSFLPDPHEAPPVPEPMREVEPEKVPA